MVRLIPRAQYTAEQKTDKFSMEFAPQWGTPYGVARTLLLSPAGMPCNAPPWGTLAAVDANTGQVKWQVPLGKLGKEAGMVNLGGPAVLATGVTLIGATFDGYFRAFPDGDGRVTLGDEVTGERTVNTDDVSARGTPVCGDCGRRT